MQSDPNDDWPDALAGRTRHPDPGVQEEIDAMRSYYRQLRQEERRAGSSGRQNDMLAWLRARGALAAPAQAPMPARRSFAANSGRYALVASVVAAIAAAVLFGPLTRDPASVPNDGVVLRGGPASQVLQAADTAAVASAIEQALSSAGAQARRVRQQQTERLEMRVPSGRLDAVRTALAPWPLTVPEDGILIIEVRPTGGDKP